MDEHLNTNCKPPPPPQKQCYNCNVTDDFVLQTQGLQDEEPTLFLQTEAITECYMTRMAPRSCHDLVIPCESDP